MPKRTSEERILRYQKKIRKLEEKRQVIPPDPDESGNYSAPAENNQEETELVLPSDDIIVNQIESLPEPEQIEPLINEGVSVDDFVQDPSLLAALGEATDVLPEFGAKMMDTLSKLWLPLLKNGMSKTNKENLMNEYLVPENCQLLLAPKLNMEISTAVTEIARNRDKKLQLFQQQLGQGITAINRGLEELFKGENKPSAIKHLSNSCRLLCDLHSIWSQYRIKLVTPGLDKVFMNIMNDLQRDQSLFGSDLGEKIKAAKTIERQGLQIKKNVLTVRASGTPQASARTQQQGNWTGPPRPSANRGGRGTYRKPPTSTRRPYPPPQVASAPSTSYNRSNRGRAT